MLNPRTNVIQGRFAAGLRGAVQCSSTASAVAIEGNRLRLPPDAFGQPLSSPTLQAMERTFGTSLSHVRVHVGQEAGRIGAQAFTLGSHIYFAPGQYSPDAPQGRRLLAHELAHVIQQQAGRVKNPLGGTFAVVQDRLLEAEADRMSLLAVPHCIAPVPPAPRRVAQPKAAPGRVIQARLYIKGNAAFLQTIQNALGALVGNASPALHYGGYFSSQVTFDNALLPAMPDRQASLTLMQRIINSAYNATIRSTNGATAAAPVRHRLWYTLGLAREGAGTAMGRVTRGVAGPGAGSDVDVFVNPANLGGAAQIWTVNGAGVEAQAAPPDSIILGHELGHADRLMRGTGAFTPQGGHVLGQFARVGGLNSAAALEEIYNIGLPLAGATPANPDAQTVTENAMRLEHGLDARSRYL